MFLIPLVSPAAPETIKSLMLLPADFKKSLALEPIEERVFFVPDPADRINPPALFSTF